MRNLLLAAVAAVALAAAPAAFASTLSFGSLTINGPASTSATCSAFASLTSPVAVGTPLCQITVQPAGWTGAIGNPTGGADSADFDIVTVSGVPTLENTVQLTNTGSAAGNGTYQIGTSQVTP